MPPRYRRLLSFALALLAAPAIAQSILPAAVPPPSIAAKAYLLVDLLSGQTLVAVNADEPREPASLTKLMTAYLVFRALKDKELTPSQMVNVSEKAWRAEGSRMFIEPKKAVSVDELLHGVIVQSGNDASIALAEAVAGSEEAFVERMNREAARIGMKNTRFVNATGLPAPQQVSTAADLALIAAAIIRDFPEYYPLYSIKEYRYNNITQSNRNRLLWSDPYVDGMKTGIHRGRGLLPDRVGKARSAAAAGRGARRGVGRRRARVEAQKLLNYGFQFYDTVQLYQNGAAGQRARGVERRERTGAGGLRRRPVRDAAEGPGAEAQAHAGGGRAAARADRPRDSAVGMVKVTLDAKPVGEYPLRGARRGGASRASSGAPGTPSVCGSSNARASQRHDSRHRRSHDRLSQWPVSCRSKRRRFRCSIAASSTATASTN